MFTIPGGEVFHWWWRGEGVGRGWGRHRRLVRGSQELLSAFRSSGARPWWTIEISISFHVPNIGHVGSVYRFSRADFLTILRTHFKLDNITVCTRKPEFRVSQIFWETRQQVRLDSTLVLSPDWWVFYEPAPGLDIIFQLEFPDPELKHKKPRTYIDTTHTALFIGFCKNNSCKLSSRS